MPDAPYLIDSLDRRLIVATQGGLPLVSRPYDHVANQLGTNVIEVRNRLARMLECGVIRRIGAVPNHYTLGYTANGMTVWDVEDTQIDELGARIGQLEFVTHCYRRPRRLPEWPYNLFAMVHGMTRDAVGAKALIIAALLGDACRACDILYSTAILKKSGMRLSE